MDTSSLCARARTCFKSGQSRGARGNGPRVGQSFKASFGGMLRARAQFLEAGTYKTSPVDGPSPGRRSPWGGGKGEEFDSIRSFLGDLTRHGPKARRIVN